MEFWKEVRQQVLTGQMSQRAALKKYGLGWHTLKKILAHAEPPGYYGVALARAVTSCKIACRPDWES